LSGGVASREQAPVGLTVYGCEPDEAELFNQLSARLGINPTITSSAPSETSVVSVPRNRCVSVGHKAELTLPTLRALKNAGVEHVSTRSIGFDHIDLDAATALGITVENVVYAPDGVADFTVMLILMVIRDARGAVSTAEPKDSTLRTVRGRDLRDLTVGVVGVGHIGAAVVRRLQGFGCRVLACSNNRPAAAAAEFVSLDELLRESDVVTLHVPLTADTHHLIGRAQLAELKHDAFLVNTGRGALIDTDALITALERGELGGAALDVLEGEEEIFHSERATGRVEHRFLPRLQRLHNVIVTPHVAYYTRRALHDTVEKTLTKCLDFERKRAHEAAHDRDPVRGLLGRA
jgi:D-specific alpha-keto acid dehydrogenase